MDERKHWDFSAAELEWERRILEMYSCCGDSGAGNALQRSAQREFLGNMIGGVVGSCFYISFNICKTF